MTFWLGFIAGVLSLGALIGGLLWFYGEKDGEGEYE